MVAPRPLRRTHPGTGRGSRRGGAGVSHNDTDVRSSHASRPLRARLRDAARAHRADRGAGGPAGPCPRGGLRRLAAARPGSGGRGPGLVGAHHRPGPLRGRERRLPRPRLPRPGRRRGAGAHQRPDRAGLLLLCGRLRAPLDAAGAARAARGPRRGGLPHGRRDRRGAGAAGLLARPVPLLPRRRARGRAARARGGPHARRVPGAGPAGRGRDPLRRRREGRALRAHLGAHPAAAFPRPAAHAARPRLPEHLGVPPRGRDRREPGDARPDGGRAGLLARAGRVPAGGRRRRARRGGPSGVPRRSQGALRARLRGGLRGRAARGPRRGDRGLRGAVRAAPAGARAPRLGRLGPPARGGDEPGRRRAAAPLGGGLRHPAGAGRRDHRPPRAARPRRVRGPGGLDGRERRWPVGDRAADGAPDR